MAQGKDSRKKSESHDWGGSPWTEEFPRMRDFQR